MAPHSRENGQLLARRADLCRLCNWAAMAKLRESRACARYGRDFIAAPNPGSCWRSARIKAGGGFAENGQVARKLRQSVRQGKLGAPLVGGRAIASGPPGLTRRRRFAKKGQIARKSRMPVLRGKIWQRAI